MGHEERSFSAASLELKDFNYLRAVILGGTPISNGSAGEVSRTKLSHVLNEIKRFETPPETPVGFGEDESLDEFIARITMLAGISQLAPCSS